jgi:hypothetical protein
MFGINARNFSQSLVVRQSLHFPEDIERYPLDVAADFVCTLFPTPEKVLKGNA